MFDIGFTELIIVAIVGLLVIGPERRPGTIRTASAWLNRFRKSFAEIRQEVRQELHNDAVLQDLKNLQDDSEMIREQTERLTSEMYTITEDLKAAPDQAEELRSTKHNARKISENAAHGTPTKSDFSAKQDIHSDQDES